MAIYTRFPPKGAEVSNAPSPRAPKLTATAPRATGLSRSQAPAKAVKAAGEAEKLNKIVPILMFSLIMPVIFNVGPLRMSPNRLILVVMIVPLLIKFFTGAAGRIRTADILVISASLWAALTFIIDRGGAAIQYAGITGIEMLGAYLMARCYIRTEEQYQALVRTFRWIALILAPLAAIEAIGQMRLINTVFDPFFQTFRVLYDTRWGMVRASPGFEHPILYGCFVAFLYSPIYFAQRNIRKPVMAFLLASPVLVATFFALSAGAYLGLIVQFLLIGWGFVTRQVPNRWVVLTVLTVLAFIVVDLLSNRTPFEVFISYLTFNTGSSYWRVLIFTHGIQNVWANPLFGLGLKDWVRPPFMYTASVDNFWLLMAMRHGIPGFFLFAGIYAAVITGLVRARPARASTGVHRNALVFSFVGLAIAIATVHLWSASFVFFMFMLGAGAWISDAPREGEEPEDDTADVDPPQGAERRRNTASSVGSNPQRRRTKNSKATL